MTGKRFTLIKNTGADECYSDNLYDNGSYIGAICGGSEMICYLLNNLYEENNKIKNILLNKKEELKDAYNRGAKVGMSTGGIIGELDTIETILEEMRWNVYE